MELAALELYAWANGVTGRSWHHLQGQQSGWGARLSPFTINTCSLTHDQFPLPSSQPLLSPPSIHPCPYVLPLRHQRRPGTWKMVLWAIVLFLSLKQFTSIARNWIARKWRFSELPKIWEGMCLKWLLLAFKLTSMIFHFSSALLIMA